MKKVTNPSNVNSDGLLPEYDFTGKKGVRGKYYRARQKGYTIRIHNEDSTITTQKVGPTITLEPDVAKYFPDSESVNGALRTLISLVPTKQIGEKRPKYVITKKSKKNSAAHK